MNRVILSSLKIKSLRTGQPCMNGGRLDKISPDYLLNLIHNTSTIFNYGSSKIYQIGWISPAGSWDITRRCFGVIGREAWALTGKSSWC